MKKILRIPLLLVALLLSSIPIFAHDFEVDGIYYNISSPTDKTVAVTYRGDGYNSYNEYSGSVIIPKTVTYGGYNYSVTSIGKYAFYDCTSLTEVTIPNSVTTIEKGAFYDCTKLTSITIPESMKWISRAFRGCSGLTEVNFNATNCNEMMDSTFGEYSCPNLRILNIGDNVKNIPYLAFSGCSGLTTVTIPNSVATIDFNAFYGCTGLTEVNITNLSAWCKISFNPNCFHSNPLVYANKLKLNGSEIKNLVIPNDITRIMQYAFIQSSITSVTMHNKVDFIMEGAFMGCDSLIKVVIPNSVTGIGNWAFDCIGLTEITSLNPEPPTCSSYAFYRVPTSSCTLYVPAGSKDAYAVAEVWKNFTNIVELSSGIEDIKDGSNGVEEVARYDIHGRLLSKPSPGINIVKMSDGSTRKEIVR